MLRWRFANLKLLKALRESQIGLQVLGFDCHRIDAG
jgi:hypothetical protein